MFYVTIIIFFLITGITITNFMDKHYEYEKSKQRTHVYCPRCNNELVKNGDLVKDTDFVYYKCSKCGFESKWDFDAPCPILIKEAQDD